MSAQVGVGYAETPGWEPSRPRLRLRRVVLSWATTALAVYVATLLLPGVHVEGLFGAFAAAALIALLNALLPPFIAALRLPFMLVAGFFLILLLDAAIFKLASDLSDSSFKVDSFWAALAAALVVAGRHGDPRGPPRHQRRRLGIFLTPVFFYVIQGLGETRLLTATATRWIGSIVAGRRWAGRVDFC